MIEGEDIAVRRLLGYAKRRGMRIARRLGSGMHGVVCEAESNAFPGFVAIKAHRTLAPFARERDSYQRLREAAVSRIRGFNVPQIVAWDDELMVVEITMVQPPFIVDFGGAWLDAAPEFTADAWDQWQRQLDEMFEDRADEVRRVLAVFQSYGVILLDVHPANIVFGDRI